MFTTLFTLEMVNHILYALPVTTLYTMQMFYCILHIEIIIVPLFFSGRTVIIIAHRLSTIQNAGKSTVHHLSVLENYF